ncbi:MAG: DNA polymerase III subunit beta [Nitriliruptorales bacterium]
MRLRAEHAEFSEAISWTTRSIGGRVSLPALAGILVEANGGRLVCRATDLEVGCEVGVPVKVEEEGKALLPGRLLAQLVARLPDAPVELEGGPDRVTLRCGRATVGMRGMVVEDFPVLPQPAVAAPRGVLKAEQFVRFVGQLVRAASSDEARPVLTGVKLEASAESLVGAATDSYRLAVRRLSWDQGVEAEALVPARALAEAAKSASETGAEVSLIFEDGQVSFLLGNRRLTTRLIEGNFPNYDQLIPREYETRTVVDRTALVEVLQRVAVVTLGQPNTPVTLTFGEGSVDLLASNPEVGDASESLPAEIDGQGLAISFNPMFLLAGLEAAGTENVVIELRDGLKPAVVRPYGDEQIDDFFYLLMPVRTS